MRGLSMASSSLCSTVAMPRNTSGADGMSHPPPFLNRARERPSPIVISRTAEDRAAVLDRLSAIAGAAGRARRLEAGDRPIVTACGVVEVTVVERVELLDAGPDVVLTA